MITTHPSVPAQSVKGLVALARARPGALTFASSGTGSAFHLAGELFKVRAGLEVVTNMPEQLAAKLREQHAHYGKLIRAAGIKPE